MEDKNKNMWYLVLHELRNWNRDWDVYVGKNPMNIDEFVGHLSDKYTVEQKQIKNN